MFSHYLSGTEDCAWLRETVFRGYDDIPAFGAFTFDGHEDCPLAVALYSHDAPNVDDSPVAVYRLVDEKHSNLSHYVRTR